jgi:hypothetical protein
MWSGPLIVRSAHGLLIQLRTKACDGNKHGLPLSIHGPSILTFSLAQPTAIDTCRLFQRSNPFLFSLQHPLIIHRLRLIFPETRLRSIRNRVLGRLKKTEEEKRKRSFSRGSRTNSFLPRPPWVRPSPIPLFREAEEGETCESHPHACGLLRLGERPFPISPF